MTQRVEDARIAEQILSGDDLLRETEVAGLLNVSTKTLTRWRKANKGPTPLQPAPGTRWIRYQRSEVQKWLDERTANGAA